MPDSYRVLVTGSRTWTGVARIYRELDDLLKARSTLTVVHGAAREGADRIAQNWAISAQCTWPDGTVTPEPHPADWGKYGRRAGFIRNAEMVGTAPDLCFAFIMPCTDPKCRRTAPHGTHGASNCAALAEAAQVETRRFGP